MCGADAVLMVCEPKTGGRILDADKEAGLPSEGEERDTLSELRSTPGRPSRPPMLRKASVALVLNAGDTGEVSNAAPQSSKKRVWWDNASSQLRRGKAKKNASALR